MIEDEELRALFQTESEEYLQSLDEGLLRLETVPNEAKTLEEVFRAAHSLKGTARMLGVTGVETVAHHLEDELGQAKQGRTTLSPAVIDRMYVGLDAMRKLVAEAITDVPADINLERILKQLSGEVPLEVRKTPTPTTEPTPSPVVESPLRQQATAASVDVDAFAPVPPSPTFATPPTSQPPAAFAAMTRAATTAGSREPREELRDHAILENAPTSNERPAEPAYESMPVSQSGPLAPLHAGETLEKINVHDVGDAAPDDSDSAPSETQMVAANRNDFRIQTMRVPPAKLDALMTLASELTVTTNRVTRGLTAFAEMGELWEEWNKELSSQRSLFNISKSLSSKGHGESTLRALADFHEQEQERLIRLRSLWTHLRQTIYEDVTRLGFVAENLDSSIRNVRLLPLSTIFTLYPRMVRDLARTQDKEVQLIIEGGETAADKRILEELKDPLMHMIRNAVDHGIETPDERQRQGKPRMATLYLRARQTSTNVIVELQDDGRGLDVESIRRVALKRRLHTEEQLLAMSREQVELLIFAPGFSTSPLVTDVSGRGVGLDVVRINIERLKGSIQVASRPGAGCTFTLLFPLTLATMRVLLVEVDARVYGLPVEYVQGAIQVSNHQFFTIEGRQTVVLGDEAIAVARLAHLLELSPATGRRSADRDKQNSRRSSSQAYPDSQVCVVLNTGTEKLAILVDALVDEQEVMLKPLGPLLKRVRNVSGVTILGAGEVCMILNPHDLTRSAVRHRAPVTRSLEAPVAEAVERRKVILLAEDSITTRTQEKRILEGAGYEVITAVDGADAFQKLGTREFDAVVSDVEMPNMDGLSLVARIRENNKHKELPIILVTSLASDVDKQRGIEVGASAYITKGTFEQKVLLDTLGRLV